MSMGIIEEAKKIITKDLNGEENGMLFELVKDGDKTVSYITTIKPGMFKGYHLHRVRKARYFCIKGKIKIILHKPGTTEREDYLLDAEKPERLFISDNIATGLKNVGEEEAWLINFPDPPYDPAIKNEQVEYSEEDLQNGVVK